MRPRRFLTRRSAYIRHGQATQLNHFRDYAAAAGNVRRKPIDRMAWRHLVLGPVGLVPAGCCKGSVWSRDQLRFLRQVDAHATMLEFRIGERVTFQPDGRPRVAGMITRYNKKSVSIVTDDGHRWNVPPQFLERATPRCRQTWRQQRDRNVAEGQTPSLTTETSFAGNYLM
jgi:hypothetical protein